MTQRTILECDRCHREIKGGDTSTKVYVGGRSIGKDLCGICTKDLQKFMDGQELEVPP